MMNIKILEQLFDAIILEAKNNPKFCSNIEKILLPERTRKPKTSEGPRGPNRRDPPEFNPTELLLSEGEEALRTSLNALNEKQLKDIIAYYGMDTARLAMKWKKTDRLINFIMDAAKRSATKGDAFM